MSSVITIYLVAFLYLLAGICNGYMDDLQFNPKSWLVKFPYFNPQLSALNKWEIIYSIAVDSKLKPFNSQFTLVIVGDKVCYKVNNYNRLWYYLWLYKPLYKERFWYSSTFLVSFTQGWHLLKFAMFSIIEATFTYFLIHQKALPDLWYIYPCAVIALKSARGLGFILVNRIAVG